jgi:geranylgeranyl pyrophosphate synthase
MGTIAATSLHPTGPDLLRAATAFGTHVGLAFQITDDILDITATPEQLGKATNKDSKAGKNTYPKLLGLEASQHLARQELTDALNALDPLGPHAHRLAAIAQAIANRSN